MDRLGKDCLYLSASPFHPFLVGGRYRGWVKDVVELGITANNTSFDTTMFYCMFYSTSSSHLLCYESHSCLKSAVVIFNCIHALLYIPVLLLKSTFKR